MLVQVKNKCERLLPVRPAGVEKTSRLGSRDPVDSGVKYGPHGCKNDKMKSRTVSFEVPKFKASILLHWTQNDVWECFRAFR
jgi:hypothetical protein